MANTVFLLDGYGWTGLLRYSTIAQALGANGGTFVQVPYNNNVGGSPSNMQAAAAMLDTYLNNAKYTPPFVVCGISMGTQVAYKWIRDYGPGSTVAHSDLSFMLLANPENPYTGSGVIIPAQMFPQGNYGGIGVPSDTPWTVTNYMRQYDGVSDYPNVANPSAVATTNAYIGMVDIHDAYMFQPLPSQDPNAHSVTEGNITYTWSGPTYPCPYVAPFSIVNYFLGVSYNPATADSTQASDKLYRPQIEAYFNRPVTIPAPAY